MSQQTIQLYLKGAEANQSDPYRKGNLIVLPEKGRVIVSGDLHGHRRHFEKIVDYADLENHPETHVIFQEILHGGPEDDYGGCLSYRLLQDAIRYKLLYPGQVHILLGNHDTAVVNQGTVMKNGREVNVAMQEAMKREYQEHFGLVHQAMVHYLLSQPLAVKTPNKIWISHSLPADPYVESFDLEIFNRPYTAEDTRRPNPVYLLTWGRHHSPEALCRMAERLEVDLFVLGHQPQDEGWAVVGNNTIILASEHSHGCLLNFELERLYNIELLSERVVPLASIL
ncbi:MAG TPA: metallophosphoesterase [Anaerohalosphaeraceae bacterium]|nr:metallophosphoesterase [Anaerohalosphaeraceae bacterium]